MRSDRHEIKMVYYIGEKNQQKSGKLMQKDVKIEKNDIPKHVKIYQIWTIFVKNEKISSKYFVPKVSRLCHFLL